MYRHNSSRIMDRVDRSGVVESYLWLYQEFVAKQPPDLSVRTVQESQGLRCEHFAQENVKKKAEIGISPPTFSCVIHRKPNFHSCGSASVSTVVVPSQQRLRG